MTHDTELSQLMQSIAEKSLQMLAGFRNQPPQLPHWINRYIDLTSDFQSLIAAMFKNPEKIWQTQIAYWQDAVGLAQEQFSYWLEGKSMPIEDKRFSSE